MAFTFTTLKTAIQDYLESSETTFVANLPTIITQAEQRILRTCQIPDLRRNDTGTLSQGNPYLTMPDGFLASYSLAIDNTGYQYLIFKDVNFMREAYPNYAVELHYMFEPESITTTASGESWLGSNAENALLYACLVEGYTFLKGEADQMEWYNAKYEDAVSRLKSLGEGYDTTDAFRSGAVRRVRI